MKIPKPLAFAFTGWMAGALATLVVGFYWPTIFPAIIKNEHYYGFGPGLVTIVGLVLLLASPAGLIGGFIGSRIPREGGQTEQFTMAAFMGALLALLLACTGLWFFTGW